MREDELLTAAKRRLVGGVEGNTRLSLWGVEGVDVCASSDSDSAAAALGETSDGLPPIPSLVPPRLVAAEGDTVADVVPTPVCDGVRRTDLLYNGGGDALRSRLVMVIMEGLAMAPEVGPKGFGGA